MERPEVFLDRDNNNRRLLYSKAASTVTRKQKEISTTPNVKTCIFSENCKEFLEHPYPINVPVDVILPNFLEEPTFSERKRAVQEILDRNNWVT